MCIWRVVGIGAALPLLHDVDDRCACLNIVDAAGKVCIDYRPVHLNTLTSDVEAIPPKARTY